MSDFKLKYLKYKNKYIKLKQFGGSICTNEDVFNIDCTNPDNTDRQCQQFFVLSGHGRTLSSSIEEQFKVPENFNIVTITDVGISLKNVDSLPILDMFFNIKEGTTGENPADYVFYDIIKYLSSPFKNEPKEFLGLTFRNHPSGCFINNTSVSFRSSFTNPLTGKSSGVSNGGILTLPNIYNGNRNSLKIYGDRFFNKYNTRFNSIYKDITKWDPEESHAQNMKSNNDYMFDPRFNRVTDDYFKLINKKYKESEIKRYPYYYKDPTILSGLDTKINNNDYIYDGLISFDLPTLFTNLNEMGITNGTIFLLVCRGGLEEDRLPVYRQLSIEVTDELGKNNDLTIDDLKLLLYNEILFCYETIKLVLNAKKNLTTYIISNLNKITNSVEVKTHLLLNTFYKLSKENSVYHKILQLIKYNDFIDWLRKLKSSTKILNDYYSFENSCLIFMNLIKSKINLTTFEIVRNESETFKKIYEVEKLDNISIKYYLYILNKGAKLNIPISEWDTSNVTDMSELFKNLENFNEDISKWNTENVTTMDNMFDGATSFTNKDLSKWDVGKLISANNFIRNYIKSGNSTLGEHFKFPQSDLFIPYLVPKKQKQLLRMGRSVDITSSAGSKPKPKLNAWGIPN